MNKKLIIITVAAVLAVAAAVFAVLYVSGEKDTEPDVSQYESASGPDDSSEPASEPETETVSESDAPYVDMLLNEMYAMIEAGECYPYENEIFIVATAEPEPEYDENGKVVSVFGLPVEEYRLSYVSQMEGFKYKNITVKISEDTDLREALIMLNAREDVYSAVPEIRSGFPTLYPSD
ncbi:MAG: hypothetical protein IKX92_06560 [Clostridia bacterium]|nr:hypothetical protein [Clostridia bacterium]